MACEVTWPIAVVACIVVGYVVSGNVIMAYMVMSNRKKNKKDWHHGNKVDPDEDVQVRLFVAPIQLWPT